MADGIIIPTYKSGGRPTSELVNAVNLIRQQAPVLEIAIKAAPKMLQVLIDIANDKEAKNCDRINASTYVINRAHGMPRKEIEFNSDGKELNILINGLPAGRIDTPVIVEETADNRHPKKGLKGGWPKGKPRANKKGKKVGRPKGSKNAKKIHEAID